MNEQDKLAVLKDGQEIKSTRVHLQDLQAISDGYALVTVENPAFVSKESIQATLKHYPKATHFAILMLNAVTAKVTLLFHDSKFYLRGVFTLYTHLPSVDPVVMDRADILDKLDEMNNSDKMANHVSKLFKNVAHQRDRLTDFINDFNPADTKLALVELESLEAANELSQIMEEVDNTDDIHPLTAIMEKMVKNEDNATDPS